MTSLGRCRCFSLWCSMYSAQMEYDCVGEAFHKLRRWVHWKCHTSALRKTVFSLIFPQQIQSFHLSITPLEVKRGMDGKPDTHTGISLLVALFQDDHNWERSQTDCVQLLLWLLRISSFSRCHSNVFLELSHTSADAAITLLSWWCSHDHLWEILRVELSSECHDQCFHMLQLDCCNATVFLSCSYRLLITKTRLLGKISIRETSLSETMRS